LAQYFSPGQSRRVSCLSFGKWVANAFAPDASMICAVIFGSNKRAGIRSRQ
jgi:hypothetical protein